MKHQKAYGACIRAVGEGTAATCVPLLTGAPSMTTCLAKEPTELLVIPTKEYNKATSDPAVYGRLGFVPRAIMQSMMVSPGEREPGTVDLLCAYLTESVKFANANFDKVA